MKVTRITRLCVSLAVALFSASAALGAFDLQITEIWPGNEPGTDLTADWFEVTNVGDTPWVAAIDGDLYFDDDSFDPTTADLMSGVASIAPGESAIFVDELLAGELGWLNVWVPVLCGPGETVDPAHLGSYQGSGLSQNGDAIGLWISFGEPSGAPDITAGYPDANPPFGGQSYDLVLGEFSTVGNASGAVATIAVNEAMQPAIGSPNIGCVPVPEPASVSILLAGLGWMLLNLRGRK